MSPKNFYNFFIFSIIGCITMPGILFGPAMVGILIDHGDFSEEFAGWVMAFGSAGSALTLIIISGYIHQINLKKLSSNHDCSSPFDATISYSNRKGKSPSLVRLF